MATEKNRNQKETITKKEMSMTFSNPMPLTEDSKVAERAALSAPNPQTQLKATRESAIAKRLKQMPQSHRLNYTKATQGKASPRAAIKAFCLECVCCDREEVKLCTALACPLWMYRPYQN